MAFHTILVRSGGALMIKPQDGYITTWIDNQSTSNCLVIPYVQTNASFKL